MTGNRRSIRLPAYDYATPAAYFVTTCTTNRLTLFQKARPKGIVERAWRSLPQRFPTVELDEFIVMPDHVHFLIHLLDDEASLPTLGQVVGTFKAFVAREINAHRGMVGASVWQRNYYEHIVRDDRELDRIRDCIVSNPFVEHSHAADDLAGAWREG